jgi:hypothetical protein
MADKAAMRRLATTNAASVLAAPKTPQLAKSIENKKKDDAIHAVKKLAKEEKGIS